MNVKIKFEDEREESRYRNEFVFFTKDAKKDFGNAKKSSSTGSLKKFKRSIVVDDRSEHEKIIRRAFGESLGTSKILTSSREARISRAIFLVPVTYFTIANDTDSRGTAVIRNRNSK